MNFEKFSSLTRFSQGWTISEKIDGTNGQIAICEEDYKDAHPNFLLRINGFKMYAGSRNRWLTRSSDNRGFARWVEENAEDLLSLGIGRHYGEWYGSGIQRTYGLAGGDKRFALFNSARWKDNEDKPSCCEVVHTFVENTYQDDPEAIARSIMDKLAREGSFQVPGFMDPEGVVLFHRKSGTSFKKTFDYDDKGKWAELQDAEG